MSEIELDEITIKYIPKLEEAINIFTKDSLYFHFDDFFNNIYKAREIVDDYVDDYLKIKSNKNVLYRLKSEVNYEIRELPEYALIYKRRSYQEKEKFLQRLFNNPFDFECINYTEDFINVERDNTKLKIACDIPIENIKEQISIYQTVLDESLYSKIHKINVSYGKELEFKENNFDHINDILKKFGKDINNITEDEHDKIPEIDEEKPKTIKIKRITSKNIEILPDNFNDIIKLINSSTNYDEDDIKQILSDIEDKNFNLVINIEMFNSIKDLYENIDIDLVKKHANDYLKKKELEKIFNFILKIKNTLGRNEVNEIKLICNRIDNVFENEYKFPEELIEIVDNEEENDLNQKYSENIDISTQILGTQNIEDDKNQFEKQLIKECDLNIVFEEMNNYINSFEKNKRIESMLFYLYSTIQMNFYNNVYNDIEINSECSSLLNEYGEPIKVETVDSKIKIILPAPDKKSIYQYVICCFKNILESHSDIYKKYSSTAIIDSKFVKFVLSEPICIEKLKELKDIYTANYENYKKQANKFYTNLLSDLKHDDVNIRYMNYVKALKYVLPYKLGKINNFISGCCSQLLNQDFKANSDIYKKKDNSSIKTLYDYRNITLLSYNNDNIKWNVIDYKNDVEVLNNIDIKYEIDDVDDEYDNVLEIDKDYLKSDFETNNYVKSCVNTFMKLVEDNDFALQEYIIKKCDKLQNMKNLLSLGYVDDMEKYYKIIDNLENNCCINKDFIEKRERICKYLSAEYLTNFSNKEENTNLYNKIKLFSSKTILSREEYNKQISNYREKLKVDAINFLESLSLEDKEVAKMLKDTGIIHTYDNYTTDYTNDNLPAKVRIPTDDTNDQSIL
jgi:hypothetical protein